MKLIELTENHYRQFEEMALDFSEQGDDRYSTFLPFEPFKDFLIKLENDKNGEKTPPHKVPGISYWLEDDDKKLIGGIRYRYKLNDALLIEGGHIGYDIRPSERNKGLATIMLSLLFDEVRDISPEKVLITCSDDNPASEKVILKHGGVLESIEPSPRNGKMSKRFWVEVPGYAQNRWNKLFADRKTDFPPEKFLVDNLHLLKEENILDLGAGDGRNSFFLADKGFHVTAADYSERGLEKISAKKNPNIKTELVDCNNPEALKKTGRFHSIVLSHFVPDFDVLKILPELLKPEGVILIIAFDKKMEEFRDFNRNLILDFNRIEEAMPQLQFLYKEHIKDERGYFNACIIKK